jgi:hypothetical protein
MQQPQGVLDMNIHKRLRHALALWEENRWVSYHTGGLGYCVYLCEQQLEWDVKNGVPGPRPNRQGLWLKVLWAELMFHLEVWTFLLFGRVPSWGME